MDKMAWDGPKWGQEDFVPTNPDLADILGRADLDFDSFFWTPTFWISRSRDLQVPRFPGSQTCCAAAYAQSHTLFKLMVTGKLTICTEWRTNKASTKEHIEFSFCFSFHRERCLAVVPNGASRIFSYESRPSRHFGQNRSTF